MALPTDPKARKAVPVWSGGIAYFPDAIVAIAELSQRANEQHNPGQPLHWAKEKSTDEADAGMRHAIEPLLIGGSDYDSDGAAHLVKKAWRACAELQRWLEAGNAAFQSEGDRILDVMTAKFESPIADCFCTNCTRARGEKIDCFLCGHPTDHEPGCLYAAN